MKKRWQFTIVTKTQMEIISMHFNNLILIKILIFFSDKRVIIGGTHVHNFKR